MAVSSGHYTKHVMDIKISTLEDKYEVCSTCAWMSEDG